MIDEVLAVVIGQVLGANKPMHVRLHEFLKWSQRRVHFPWRVILTRISLLLKSSRNLCSLDPKNKNSRGWSIAAIACLV